MHRRKRITCWIISIFFVLVATDFIIGIVLLTIIKPRPVDAKSGLPPMVEFPKAHPYKSYVLHPGNLYWAKDAYPLFRYKTQQYDFGVIDGGTVIDPLGHQVLPSDLGIETRAKPPDEIRLFFLGGSTTFQPWPHLTAELLNRRAGGKHHFVAINGGVGGYTSQENLIDLITSGLAYQPDMVIAYLPINDIYWPARYSGWKRDYTHMRTPLISPKPSGRVEPPKLHLTSYPFTLQLIEWLIYRYKVREYAHLAGLQYLTMHAPLPEAGIDGYSFEMTVKAVIDNISSMKSICDRRGIKMLILTQKVFQPDGEVEGQLLKDVGASIEKIRTSPLLSDVSMLELQTIVPDEWNESLQTQLQREFPSARLRFDQGMAYDSMHFTPDALHLVASVLTNT